MHSAQINSSALIARRRHHSRVLPLTLAALVVGLLPVEAQAACRQGFCVSGFDQDGFHTVTFSTTLSNYTNFNANTPQGQQELGLNVRQFTFRNGPSGKIESYALQACHKGGPFQSSKCTPWATFTHTPR